MVFSSITFIFLFLPILLLVYFLVKPKHRNIVLLIFSILFYFWGEKTFTVVILTSCLVNYILGILIYKYQKKWLLIFSLIYNFGLLGCFKYLNFLIDNLNLISFLPHIDLAKIHLPIGISFFTFQAVSYIVDIYNKKIEPSSSLKNFALYLMLFPQLIAGPIIRYKDIAKEIIDRKIGIENFSYGIKRFIAGLSKKVLIANTLAVCVDNIFSTPITELSPAICSLGGICYAFQIYFDFSGYSDMAIGLGRMFGFHFLENFNFPYIAKSFSDFWRRWHISLSGWFKDYVYIPLGGKEKHVYLNLLIVFFLTGLWHGASWNFIIWGMFNGAFVMIEKTCILKKLPLAICHIYLLTGVLIGWVIFRSPDLSYALQYLSTMFGFSKNTNPLLLNTFLNKEIIATVLFAAVLSTPIFKNIKFEQPIFKIIKNFGYAVLLVVSASYLATDTYNPFIYFRF